MRPVSEGVLIDTDVFAEFLLRHDNSIFLLALTTVPCYTTVVQAAELLGAAQGDAELMQVNALLGGIRVLGFSAKYAKTMGKIVADARKQGTEISTRDAMVAGAALEGRLPILTVARADLFRSVGVHVVTPQELRDAATQGDKH